MSETLLSLIIFLPLLGALAVMLIPVSESGIARFVGLVASLVTFGFSLALLTRFDASVAGFQLEHRFDWVESIGIRYHVGVDGISLWMVLLTTFLTPITLLSSQNAIVRRPRDFVVALLVLETGMLGAFLALDLFLFYVFWELMLVPMYLIIGIWGGERRLFASIKFVLYTMVGSLLMLVAIIYLYVRYHDVSGTYSFDYADISRMVLGVKAQLFCFMAFGLAFAIKVPLWPLHTWLPDAHVEAPTPGSVILAGVLLKLGTYGLLRFAIPLFPYAFAKAAPILAILSLIGVVYGSLVAFAQKDVKKLVAYSSVAHLAMVVLGLLAWNARAISGSVFIMLAHGLYSGGLFLAIGMLYERRHTRKLEEFGGIWSKMPIFGGCFLVIVFASVGLPGLVGFVGEFLVLSGTFDAYKHWTAAGLPVYFAHPKVVAAIATTSVILGAVYMLYMFQKVMFGPVTQEKNQHLKDLSLREVCVLVPIMGMIFWMGLKPQTFLEPMQKGVSSVMDLHYKRLAATQRVGGGTPLLLDDKVAAIAVPVPRRAD